jgi:carboxypeptidase family protein/TonB-dependent receptor-like protein
MKYLVVFLAIVFAMTSFGQTFGEITGSVTDASGAAIPGAEVSVTNAAAGVTRTVQTNESGNYSVPFLTPGPYDLTAKSDGFKIVSTPGLIVQVGDVQQVNFQLEVGAVTESIEVSAAAQMLATSSTATGTVIEQQRIVELPLNGRNYLQLVKLSPNVTAEMGAGGQANGRQGGERANQALSIAGMRQTYNRFTLDGVENTDPNFNTFVVRPSVDALQEFKVQSGVYSAEFGRAPSQINVTTKAGTNEFHGTAFWFWRNKKIEARQWQKHGEKPAFNRNQFGATATGPIIKNKLFFMANYEGLRQRQSRLAQATVADAAMWGGDFSNPSFNQLYDPLTIMDDGSAQPFAGNQIPSARISPTFLKLREFYSDPTVSGAVVGSDPFNYTRDRPDPIDWDQFTTRIDWSQGPKSQWFGRFSYGTESVQSGQTFEQQDAFIKTKTYQIMLSNVRTIGTNVVNELRLGANIFDNDKVTFYNGQRNVTEELGIIGLIPPIEAAWGTPGIGFTGNNHVSGWGEATGGPFINANRTYQLLDNVSVIKGNHTIKFGGELASRRYNQIGNQFPRGFFQFPSQYTALPTDQTGTGDAFATGLLGWTSEATRAMGIANTQFRQWSWALYVEDSWKLRRNLTLNIGMRYERTPAWKDRYRGIFNVRITCSGVGDQGHDPNCADAPTIVRPGDGDFHQDLNAHLGDNVPKATGDNVMGDPGRALVKTDRNDFAPRIGLSWQPMDKMTIRAGYGLFYAQDSGNPVFDMGRNLGFRESSRNVDLRPSAPLKAPWAVKTGGGSGVECSNWDGLCLAGLYTFANQENRRTAYVHQYLFNVQYQLTDTMMIEAGYQGNNGHKLPRMFGWNTPVERNGPNDTTSANGRRPWGGSEYGRVQTVEARMNSNYNALSFKLQQRFSKGLTYLVGYTWGRAIDGASSIRNKSGDNLFPASNYDFTSERGLSQFHQAHRLTASILYDIPIGQGKMKDLGGVGNAVLGDWSVGNIITISTGQAFNPGSCGDLNGNFQGNRGDGTGISFSSGPGTPQEYYPRSSQAQRDATGSWNAAVTCVVPDSTGVNELTYRQGHNARSMFIAPGVANWDFSVRKAWQLREMMNLEFRFESFNFANHPQWNRPSTSRNSTNFGVITSARDMRINQLALKLNW